MNTLRKLALAGVGLAFLIGLAVTEGSAQSYGRSYGNRSYGRSYGYNQPRYASYGNRRYYNNGYGSGLSWRARRILAIRRAKMIRAQNRYYRTRSRILNRYDGYNRNSNVYYYRNY